jgi:hypothetical protein
MTFRNPWTWLWLNILTACAAALAIAEAIMILTTPLINITQLESMRGMFKARMRGEFMQGGNVGLLVPPGGRPDRSDCIWVEPDGGLEPLFSLFPQSINTEFVGWVSSGGGYGSMGFYKYTLEGRRVFFSETTAVLVAVITTFLAVTTGYGAFRCIMVYREHGKAELRQDPP